MIATYPTKSEWIIEVRIVDRMAGELWAVGEAYEAYMGRWSRQVAEEFLRWLEVPAGRRWLDAGSGTGALTSTVLATADPVRVVGVDPSPGFLARAARSSGPRASFHAGDARSLPLRDRCFDAVVSGLALNFVPDPASAVAELARVAAPGGTVAAYVWDYADGMEMLRHFWDAAIALDSAASELDEGRRFSPLCRPDALSLLWIDAGLRSVTVRAIEVPTVFVDFDDYWTPFLGGQGPAPGYLMSLSEERRAALRELLRARLPTAQDGSIPLTARAWAVRGTPE